MEYLNNIQFHEWEDNMRNQVTIRAVLTLNTQMTVSEQLLQSSASREIKSRARQQLVQQIKIALFGDVIEELVGLRQELFKINDPSVIPALDRVSGLMVKLRESTDLRTPTTTTNRRSI